MFCCGPGGPGEHGNCVDGKGMGFGGGGGMAVELGGKPWRRCGAIVGGVRGYRGGSIKENIVSIAK